MYTAQTPPNVTHSTRYLRSPAAAAASSRSSTRFSREPSRQQRCFAAHSSKPPPRHTTTPTAPPISGEFYRSFLSSNMDENMKQFQKKLTELEVEAEHLLLARHQLVEIDRLRNGNREALTALRKRARTTKSSVPSPFESIMKGVAGTSSRPLVQEVCTTCGKHDSSEKTWMMFPGTDLFAIIPFHVAHTILETDQTQLDFEAKRLQSIVKEKSYTISEAGVLADKISPGVLKSLVSLNDKPK